MTTKRTRTLIAQAPDRPTPEQFLDTFPPTSGVLAHQLRTHTHTGAVVVA